MNVTGIIASGSINRHRLVPDIYVAIRYTTVSGTFVESPGGTWGTGPGFGLATLSLPASTDGTYQADFNGASYDDVVIGWDAANTNTDYTGFDYGVFVDSGSQHYATTVNGTLTDTGVTAAAGDKMRLKRTGSTITAEKTSDNTTWTTLTTFAATTTARLYNKADSVSSGGSLLSPLGTGMT